MDRLRWGIVGGGEGSQIGFTHRAGAELDRKFSLAAGAFDIKPERSRAFGAALGVDCERVYGDWKEMLAAESARSDRLDLVTVATPNNTHYEIASAFLKAGFHVFCEKPLTTDRETARELERTATELNRICAVNFGYTGHPLVRQMRTMALAGELGKLRLVKAEFAGGFLSDADNDENPRVRWRFDPEQAGPSCVMADMGCHAMHLACFVTGQSISSLAADFAHCVPGRQLEDDAWVAFRLSDGAIGRLWVSGVAIGRTHGLTLQVFGEKGGMAWQHEHPEQLLWTPFGGATQMLERGGSGLSEAARRANRVNEGSPEGVVLAFSNIYRDLAEIITAEHGGKTCSSLAMDYPDVASGRHMVDVVCTAVESSASGGCWLDVN